VHPASFDTSPGAELPAYLTAPPLEAHRTFRQWRDDLARAWWGDSRAARTPDAPAVPFGGVTRRQSSTFFMMVALRRDGLPAALDTWWANGQKAGSVRVRRRLELKPPDGDAGAGWRMQGRLRCITPLHWIPVVVELWPRYDEFTMMTMTPQRPVLATRRYFRVGHAVLNRLWVELAFATRPPAQKRQGDGDRTHPGEAPRLRGGLVGASRRRLRLLFR
jgi:hypothetical protein